jgi:hypothetical protein
MSFLNKFYCIVIFFLLLNSTIQSQTVLNGTFENTLATNCVYNPSTVVFDSLMPYVHFTPHRFLGADIVTHNCHHQPFEGDWSIAIASKGLYVDRISLKLSQPLIVGNPYELTYWIYCSGFQYGDSLLIGITTDTAQFGIQIDKALSPQFIWIQKTVLFTPTIAATDITAKLDWADTGDDSWVWLDEFVLTNLITGVHELGMKEEIQLYPNPAFETFTIKTEKPFQDVRLELYNMNGQLIQFKEIPFLEEEEFDISNLAIGVYFIQLQSGIKTKTLKLIKNQ